MRAKQSTSEPKNKAKPHHTPQVSHLEYSCYESPQINVRQAAGQARERVRAKRADEEIKTSNYASRYRKGGPVKKAKRSDEHRSTHFFQQRKFKIGVVRSVGGYPSDRLKARTSNGNRTSWRTQSYTTSKTIYNVTENA